MTTEEKAKAYDMALEGARKELGVDRKEWEVVQRVLHNIFPQLAESEDERVAKEIKQFILDNIGEISIDDKEYSWLTFLEKKKEQKPWSVGANAYFTPEQKPSWSEEDEKVIEAASTLLCEYAGYYKEKDMEAKNLQLFKVSQRLKSLRPSKK